MRKIYFITPCEYWSTFGTVHLNTLTHQILSMCKPKYSHV
ncbi:hypothetical protein DM860_005437 [Cuscuta australis]|uniref:Uncharacterized protein n=1 Tax=Cuscuta australis TaxID=267555 RepID=A0A328E3T5_9ASTE|nr:hypothetical protein DM860_005437 [Cuscuta australis]